jgi:hypothetical protein
VGRIVQCARCAHRWLQTVAAAKTAAAARDAVESAMNSPLTAPKPAAAVSAFSPDAPDHEPDRAPEPIPAMPAPSLGAAAAFDAAPDLVIRPPRQRTSLPAVIAPRRRLRLPTKVLVAAAAVIVLVVAVAAGIYFYGDQLIAGIPPEWRTVLNLH